MAIVKEGNDYFLVTKTKLRSSNENEIDWLVKFVGGGWSYVSAPIEPSFAPLDKAKKEYPKHKITSVVPMTAENEKRELMNFD